MLQKSEINQDSESKRSNSHACQAGPGFARRPRFDHKSLLRPIADRTLSGPPGSGLVSGVGTCQDPLARLDDPPVAPLAHVFENYAGVLGTSPCKSQLSRRVFHRRKPNWVVSGALLSTDRENPSPSRMHGRSARCLGGGIVRNVLEGDYLIDGVGLCPKTQVAQVDTHPRVG